MDWQDLHILQTAARAGSFSGAGRALGLGTSTVKRRVDAAEAALGFRVFLRSHRGLTLTDDGQAVVQTLTEVGRVLDGLPRQHGSRLQGRVSLSVPTFLSPVLAGGLAELAVAHPELRLTLREGNRLASLRDGEADLAVRLARIGAPSESVRRIADLPLALVTGAHDPARPGPGAAWIGLSVEGSSGPLSEHAAMASLTERTEPLLRVPSFAAITEALCRCRAVAILPRLVVDGDDRLVALPAELPPRSLWLLSHPDTHDSPAIRAVVRVVEQALEAASLTRGVTVQRP